MSPLTPPVSDLDHRSGPEGAPVTLVEYGDFECPHCGRAHPIVSAIQRQMGSRLRFVYRHFPLAQAHPHAQQAAEAAEAAAAQGKFWEMHHSLFEHQEALEREDLVARAEGFGLDVERLAAELADGVHTPRVRRDFSSGVRSGVNGTPTFFINGQRFDKPWDPPILLAALERAAEQR